MAAIGFSIGKFHAAVQIPDCLEDLRPEQMKKIFRQLFTATDTGELRLAMVKKLILDQLPKRFRNSALYDSETIYELSEQLGFLWNQTSGIAWFPWFKHRGTRYHLPGDNFHFGSLIEFIYADQKLQAYAESTDAIQRVSILNELVAILCRTTQKGWWKKKYRADQHTGDSREKFNATMASRRAKRLATLSPEYKTYVLRYFVGCKLHIMSSYPTLFPEYGIRNTENEKGIPSPSSVTPSSVSPWLTLLKDVASTQLYGDYDKTAHYNLHTILTNAELDARRRAEKNA